MLFHRSTAIALVIIAMLPHGLGAQGALEKGKTVGRGNYPVEWPSGPSPNSMPKWAQNGLIRFSRWDGGRIETAKAILSGWSGFWPPDPDILYSTTNWYDPRTIRFLQEAGINMIWVTFSNGFSNQTENLHQAEVARYIAECHRQGIHVMAYESIANMFWQDMYENVPESRNWPSVGKDGKPVPYGAASYQKLGYVSRYMADLGNLEWLAYLRSRIDLAIDAGADGVMYDNNFSSIDRLMNVYRMIYQYGASKKPDFLLMGNFHQDTYVFNQLTNCMTTEDGKEPGVFDDVKVKAGTDPEDAVTVGTGHLIGNMGMFRLLHALSEGWKLNLVEDGQRHGPDRLLAPISAARQQLALAEAMSSGVSEELYVEDNFATHMWNGDPQTLDLLSAIGRYNRFFADHREYYAGVRPVASIAVVLDDSSKGVGLLNNLAARNVLFDVVSERELMPAKLAHYSTVALLTARTVGDAGLEALKSYVDAGGKLFTAGDAATLNRNGEPRPRPDFFGKKSGKGKCTYYDQVPSAEKLAQVLTAEGMRGLPGLDAPAGIVYNVVEKPGNKDFIVHLLNYTLAPTDKIRIVLHGQYQGATLLSPDLADSVQLSALRSAGGSEIIVPKIGIYALLVLHKS